MRVYGCRYQDLPATVGGKLKWSVGGVVRSSLNLSVLPFIYIKYIVKCITLNKVQGLVLAGQALALNKPVSLLLDECSSVTVDKGVATT